MKFSFRKKTGIEDPRKSTEVMVGGRRKNDETNPYLSARRTWNAHISEQIRERDLWRIVALLSLMISLSAVGGILYIGSQSKFIPYIVEVDKLGQISSAGPVETVGNIDPRIIKSILRTFITNARLVTSDITVERSAIFNLYAYIAENTPAMQKMNEWLNGTPQSSPFKRAKEIMVSTHIISVIPQSVDTWQIDWQESTRDRKGNLIKEPVYWRAMITLFTAPTLTLSEEQKQRNPLGIYVKNFSWSTVLSSVVEDKE
jgi:type IV secretion system protein VirB5